MASKPSVYIDWISDDDPTKLTSQNASEQDLGFVNNTPASPTIMNWILNTISKWLIYIDELILDQIDDGSTYGKVKLDSLTSNEVDHDKILNNGSSGVHGVSGDVVGTSDSQTLTTKTIDADNNIISNLEHGAEVDDPSSGVHGVSGDIVGTSDSQTLTTKTIDADNNTISNLEHGAEVDNPSSGVHGVTGDIVGTSDNQTLTTKTIDADSNTISNLEHGAEVDDPTTGVHGMGSSTIVGTDLMQTLTQKTLTSPKINEDVILTSTSSEIDAAVTASGDAVLGDGTSGLTIRCARLLIEDGTNANTAKITMTAMWNGDSISVTDNIPKSGSSGDYSLDATGTSLTISSSAITGNCITVLSTEFISGAVGAQGMYGQGVSNDLNIIFQSDITSLVDVSSFGVFITYVTAT